MTAKHTPGPWLTNVGVSTVPRIIVPRGALVATTEGSPLAARDANARLIAAAPELFTALQTLTALCIAQDINLGPAVANASAVLAKAEGTAR